MSLESDDKEVDKLYTKCTTNHHDATSCLQELTSAGYTFSSSSEKTEWQERIKSKFCEKHPGEFFCPQPSNTPIPPSVPATLQPAKKAPLLSVELFFVSGVCLFGFCVLFVVALWLYLRKSSGNPIVEVQEKVARVTSPTAPTANKGNESQAPRKRKRKKRKKKKKETEKEEEKEPDGMDLVPKGFDDGMQVDY